MATTDLDETVTDESVRHDVDNHFMVLCGSAELLAERWTELDDRQRADTADNLATQAEKLSRVFRQLVAGLPPAQLDELRRLLDVPSPAASR